MTASRLVMRAGQRSLWHPKHLSPSVLMAWWNADDHGTTRMTDDGAGLISAWVDRVGGLTPTAATTARPTWTSTAFNSIYAGLTFDGVANVLILTSGVSALPNAGVEGWIFCACSALVDASTVANFISYGGSTSGTYRGIQKSGTANTSKPAVNNGTDFAFGDASMATTPHIIAGNYAAVTQNGYIDGTAFSANPASTGALATGTTRIRMGEAATASVFGNIVLRHAMVLSGALSTANRQKLEGWLAWDSGLQASLPATHPYQRFRP